MFLAYKEIIHNKARYLLVMATFVLIAYLVFFLTGLATGLARNNRTAIDALPGNYVLQLSQVDDYQSITTRYLRMTV